MTSIVHLALALKKFSPRFLQVASFAVAICTLAAAQSLPQVHLDASGLAPRPIEELTGTTIARLYALAWSDMARALESGRSEVLSEEFTGIAKDRLVRRIGEQNQAGVHVRIVDHGHQLKAVFYSKDGSATPFLD